MVLSSFSVSSGIDWECERILIVLIQHCLWKQGLSAGSINGIILDVKSSFEIYESRSKGLAIFCFIGQLLSNSVVQITLGIFELLVQGTEEDSECLCAVCTLPGKRKGLGVDSVV